jgi:hypothetical protein
VLEPPRSGKAAGTRKSKLSAGGSKTRQTPRLEAGCNKPAPHARKQAVEVVRNDEDGTTPSGGTEGAKPERRLGRPRHPEGGSGPSVSETTEGRL